MTDLPFARALAVGFTPRSPPSCVPRFLAAASAALVRALIMPASYDCSRLAYTELLTAETGDACTSFRLRAAAWFSAHGATPCRVMTDNAFSYTKSRAYKAALTQIRARHITTRPYRPRTNGKAERFIQTALREWLYAKPYQQSADRAADMSPWLHWYNHHRPHSALRAIPPASRLNNVLGNDS